MGQLLGRRNRQDFRVPGEKDAREERRVCQASDGEKLTSHVRSRVEWPLAASLIGPGVAVKRLEMN